MIDNIAICEPSDLIYKPQSAFYMKYDKTIYINKYVSEPLFASASTINSSIFISTLISEDSNKPCYKTSIRNMQKYLQQSSIYNNSKKKSLIEENINDFICAYGKNKKESINNMKEKIDYNVKMHTNIKTTKQEIDKMSQIFFEIIDKINNELS